MSSLVAYRLKRALVIGINDYPNDPLNYCVNDAEDLRDALESIGFCVTYASNCGLAQLYTLIETFASETQPTDLVLVYFAGHGKQCKGENWLLPAKYCFDIGGNESDFITTNAFRVHYLTQQIGSKNCAATIYLFDCCRSRIVPKRPGDRDGLAQMYRTRQTLIVYACAPGRAVQDETRNGRNASFMENLLRHIPRANTHIEEIMEDVEHAVRAQTRGFQVPHRSSSITGKLYLVVEDRPESQATAQPARRSTPQSYRDNGNSLKASPRRPQTRTTVGISHDQRSRAVVEPKRPSKKSTWRKRSADFEPPLPLRARNSNHTSSSAESNEEDVSDGDIPKTTRSFVKDEDLLKSTRTPVKAAYSDHNPHSDLKQGEEVTRAVPADLDYENDWDPGEEERTGSSPRMTTSELRGKSDDELQTRAAPKPSVVRLRTLCRSYAVAIARDTTMEHLIKIIWHKTEFDDERYTPETHTLLLFNHRLHIFVDSDPHTLVTDVLTLSPLTDASGDEPTHFYIYALPHEQADSMYDFDADPASVFGNPDAWHPSHFQEHKQLPRPQSVLLSSLYALRLYFRDAARDAKNRQLSLEAQFFLHLRRYLFPPAILALKHAIDGFMFNFEKALLTDALIQLLTRLCDTKKINPGEIFDFVPLLICWVLEKCDLASQAIDSFQTVDLIDSKQQPLSYFQNPVTTSQANRKALLLEEFDASSMYTSSQHHHDIRSLTSHLTQFTRTFPTVGCKCTSYSIYDPTHQDAPTCETMKFWTDDETRSLYTTMATSREYRTFCINARGAVTEHIQNKLVLLEEDRTVAVLIKPKNVIRPGGKTAQDVDHFFQIFDPLRYTKEEPYRTVVPEALLDEEQQLSEPRLPAHFRRCLQIAIDNRELLVDATVTFPASQVTVILLDRSRSMSDKRVVSPDSMNECSHINICKIMLYRLSETMLSTNEVHAFGIIEFAAEYKTVCPITRVREQFDKALSFADCNGEWTRMYDALREAIRQIKTFVDSPLRASKGCKKLIICFSDGIDNCSQTPVETLQDSATRDKVVIDFISFIGDDQLKNAEEARKAKQMRQLCAQSGGYAYRHLQTLSNIDLASMFEQESTVWLSKRAKQSSGTVTKPERYIHPAFYERAMRQLAPTEPPADRPGMQHIAKEFKAMVNYPSDDVLVFAVHNKIAFWKVILKGPAGTFYEGRFWMLHVEFDSKFPRCPPSVRFETPIYHVNITGDGKICHQILTRDWCTQTKMSAVFENILDLLKNPNFDDAASLEKAHLYRERREDYQRQAREHAEKYASDDIEALKRKHQLTDD